MATTLSNRAMRIGMNQLSDEELRELVSTPDLATDLHAEAIAEMARRNLDKAKCNREPFVPPPFIPQNAEEHREMWGMGPDCWPTSPACE